MSTYDIKLTLPNAENDTLPAEAGSVTPVSPLPDVQGGEMPSLAAAMAMTTIPARVGKQSVYYADQYLRSLDQKDNGANVDPNFKPFEVWKENGHTQADLDAVMNLNNWDEYNTWQAFKADTEKNAQVINDAGLTAEVASFALNLGTDPTVYMGFGLAGMLEKGASKAVAYGTAGLAQGVAYETLQQYADPDRTAQESAINIAAAATISGLLGKTMDAWGDLAAKKLLKEPDFQKASKSAIDEIQAAHATRSDLSAAAAPLSRESDQSIGGNIVGRLTGRGFRYASPKMYGQTAIEGDTSTILQKMNSNAVKSKGNYAGEAQPTSLADVIDIEQGKAIGRLKGLNNELTRLKKEGIVLDADGEKRALLLAKSRRSIDKAAETGEYTPAEIAVAKSHRENSAYWNEALDKVDGYRSKKQYGAPLIIDRMKVTENFDVFRQKLGSKMVSAKENVLEKIGSLEKRVDELQSQLKKIPDTDADARKALSEILADAEDDWEVARALRDASDEELLDDATILASQYASGIFDGIPSDLAAKQMPKRFRQRMLDMEEFIDFIETDPYQLWAGYAREVTPFQASQQVFGARTPEIAIADYGKKMEAKYAKALADGDTKLAQKLLKEREGTESRLNNSWEQHTGEFGTKEAKTHPGLVKVTNGITNIVRPAMLGGQVMASVNEIAATTLFHGLRGGGQFTKVLGQMIADPAMRQMSKAQANYAGLGLEAFTNKYLHDRIGTDLMKADVADGISKATSDFARLGSRMNASVFYDSAVRTAVTVSQNGILKDGLERLVKGKVGKEELADLAYLGFDKTNAPALIEQLKTHGTEVKGTFFANTKDWTNKALAQKWEVALRRDLARTTLMPGVGDTPFFFKTSVGKVVSMFKSWPVVATQKYLIGTLQRSDAGLMTGVAMMVGTSAMIDMLYNASKGTPISTDPEEILWAGINRSGIIGVVPELGGSYLMNRLFDIQSGGGKMWEYQDAKDWMSGPVGSYAQDVAGLARPTDSEGLRQGWINSMIDVLPIPIVKPYLKAGIENLRENAE